MPPSKEFTAQQMVDMIRAQGIIIPPEEWDHLWALAKKEAKENAS